MKLKQLLKKRIPASSLFLAITVSLIITVNLSGMFLLTLYQRQYATDNLNVKKLIHTIDEGITFILQNYGQLDYNKPYSVDLFGEQNDSLLLEKKYWGWYDQVNLTATDGSDSLHKRILVGSAAVSKGERIAIYIENRSEHININNDSYIKGKIILPFRGYKSKNGLGTPSLPHLEAELSATQLPLLREDRLKAFSTILKVIKENKSAVEMLLKNNNPLAIGKIIDCSKERIPAPISTPTIIYSSTALIIDKEYSLKDLIIYAPSVVIRSGFIGDVQIFCTDSIIVEDHCILNYPSALTLTKHANNSPKTIKIGQHCQVNGAVIAIDEAFGFERCRIRIGQYSIIYGTIYSMGMLENHAKIYGTIISSEVTDGTLINDIGTIWIDATAIPEIYGEPMLFAESKKYEFIR